MNRKANLMKALVLAIVGIGAFSCGGVRHAMAQVVVDPGLAEVHVDGGQTLEVKDPDPGKLYIAESGSTLIVKRQQGNPSALPVVRVIARGGSHVEAHGTKVDVSAQPGAVVDTYDGADADAEGATVHAYGSGTIKALKGAIIYNYGTGEEYAFDGSVSYVRNRGRTFAFEGSTVYAKSPENCDACTQVVTEPGSITHVYDGAEAFATKKGGATMYLYKGGEGHCNRKCTAYVYPGAENKLNPKTCTIHEMPEPGKDTPDPFAE
jgi:hypothetical protein